MSKVKIDAKVLGRKTPIQVEPYVSKVKEVVQSRIELQELDQKIREIDTEDIAKMELVFSRNKLKMFEISQNLIKSILPLTKSEISKLDQITELDLVNLRVELTNKILYPNGFSSDEEDAKPSKS